MKHPNQILRSLAVFFLAVACASVALAQVPQGVATPKQSLYGYGSWDSDSLGNHRVVLRVTGKAAAVRAIIPWRRRDVHPEQKNVIVIDAATGKRIVNTHWARIDREIGELVFEPQTAPGEYYVYYLLYKHKGSRNYPKGIYQPMEQTADEGWIRNAGLDKPSEITARLKSLPRADVVQFQSIDAFNSFFPMEVIATAAEVEALLAKNPKASYLLFPEDREHPIKMTSDLPYRWIEKGPVRSFSGSADRGEFFSLQIGLFAAASKIEDVNVRISDLKGENGRSIPAGAFSSLNTEGIDWRGNTFEKVTRVEKGKVQALWMGVLVPSDIPPGTYRGEITLSPKGMEPGQIKFELTVSGNIATAAGDDDPSKLTRLRWLNSQLAADDSIVPPYIPLRVNGRVLSLLGRDVTLSENGLPAQIVSHFAPEVTSLLPKGRTILKAPMSLVFENADGTTLRWKGEKFQFAKRAPGIVSWTSNSHAGALDVSVLGQLEFDGFADFRVTVTSQDEVDLNDVRLEIPLEADAAKYMMGLGVKGGFRPKSLEWKWNKQFNQDAIWLGDVNAGVQVSLRDENYVRPLNTNFYLLKPLNLPPSWYNEGNGGIQFDEHRPGTIDLRAFSGKRVLKKGESLHFYFSLLITPFKLIDTDEQWKTRYFHKYQPVEEIRKAGANTINVHHATQINPYINYPFLRPAEMKAYIDSAHEQGMRVKIYYTVRELSNRAPELFALRSLGDEVLSYGPGGGFSWLQEHLDSSYIAAWFVPELKDAAIINSGVSRWHNYYVEGLNWLVKNVGIDGIYIDDVAFDRTTMKRVRKVLDRNRPAALIDLHSANQFNPRDGFANSANLYLEHFPYLNRLWFGEYFDYDSSPDFWMVEVAGIPFGLMGEMLEKGGNPWRGMVYGMTARLPWAGDPTPVWKIWDQFGMEGSRMIGYWSPECPVKTDNPNVLATVYLKRGKVLIALASWDPQRVECALAIDWKALGLDKMKSELIATASKDFQPDQKFQVTDKIRVEPGRGWLLELREK
jgi:hypothetical protein